MKRGIKAIVLLVVILLLMGCSNVVEPNKDAVENRLEDVLEPGSVMFTSMGRSSVRLDFNDGTVVYIDPYSGSVENYAPEADLVLVTHQHSDHNVIDRVTLKEEGIVLECPDDIRSGMTKDYKNLKITAVDAYNDNHSESVSAGFIIEYKDIVIYHSGDTSTTKQMKTFKEYDIDYALLCMDGYYNMDPEEASDVATLIEAEVVIPIHTSQGGDYDQKNVDLFNHSSKVEVKVGQTLKLMDLDQVLIPFDESIEDIIFNRLKALETKDYDLYMTSITKVNPYFYNEQERWFMGMTDDKISEVTLEILSTEMIDEHTAVVNLHQTHMLKELFDFEYPLLFKYEQGRWKDYGYHFEVLETERFTIRYMKGETRVEEFKVMLNDAFDNLVGLYTEKPHPYFEMKLFSDQEMLRQRCIPANEWLFTGWSEPDESLKLYTGHPLTYEGYPGVVQHELVHHITIRIANNNLPVWILEGIAMYDGSAEYGFESSGTLSNMSKRGVKMSLKSIEGLDLSSDLSRDQILNFYNASYMYVRYINETYGRDALMALFYEAGKKPFHDSTLNDTFESNNQITADEVLLEVLNITKEDLTVDYLNWLKEVDFL